VKHRTYTDKVASLASRSCGSCYKSFQPEAFAQKYCKRPACVRRRNEATRVAVRERKAANSVTPAERRRERARLLGETLDELRSEIERGQPRGDRRELGTRVLNVRDAIENGGREDQRIALRQLAAEAVVMWLRVGGD